MTNKLVQDPDAKRLLVAFASVTTLFFAWGFITSMNDPLIPAVRAAFNLNYTESLLTQFAFFIAYGVVSIPAGKFVARLGYGQAIVWALLAMVVGCLGLPLATFLQRYWMVLVSLFVIASGMTILQVAANPLSAALGSPERSHFRLTLSQAFNSLGTVFGPYLGASIMLSGGMFTQGATDAARAESLKHIDYAYFLMAALLAALTVFVWTMRTRLSNAVANSGADRSVGAALKSKWAKLGAAAIFLYVGSEVSVGSLMSNFLHQPDIFDISLESAGKFVSLYWLGAMVGRFAGSWLLMKVSAPRLLMIAAGVAALLCLTVSQTTGMTAGVVALSIGLFNSIMFPVIFTITLERSSASAEATSGLLCMAIVGGALLPLLAGKIADAFSLHWSYLVPLVGYSLIALFAFNAGKAKTSPRAALDVVAPL